MRFPSAGWTISVALVVLAVAGCNKPTAGGPTRVTGVVTMQGRPLAGGVVVFVPDADRGCTGKLHTAAIADDGSYQLADGAAAITPGWYRVALADPAGWRSSEASGGGRFPTSLRRPDLSGLEREVKAGQGNAFEFHIEAAN